MISGTPKATTGFNCVLYQSNFYDPDFWKALATARKWKDVNASRFHWHRFIDHLADGKDAESFLDAL
jgi:hypothetical protein